MRLIRNEYTTANKAINFARKKTRAGRDKTAPVILNVMPTKEMNTEKLHNTVKKVTDLLAKEKYKEIESLCNGVQLNAEELAYAVKDYGMEILPLPKEGYEKLDIVEVTDSNPKEWSIYVPIYTTQEGMSVLTLELSLIDNPSELYQIEVDNLHVM